MQGHPPEMAVRLQKSVYVSHFLVKSTNIDVRWFGFSQPQVQVYLKNVTKIATHLYQNVLYCPVLTNSTNENTKT